MSAMSTSLNSSHCRSSFSALALASNGRSFEKKAAEQRLAEDVMNVESNWHAIEGEKNEERE